MQEDMWLGLFFWILGFIIWLGGVWSNFENWLDKKVINFQKIRIRFIATVKKSLEEKKPGAEISEAEKIPLKIEIAIIIASIFLTTIFAGYENARQYIKKTSPVISISDGENKTIKRRPLLMWDVKIGKYEKIVLCL